MRAVKNIGFATALVGSFFCAGNTMASTWYRVQNEKDGCQLDTSSPASLYESSKLLFDSKIIDNGDNVEVELEMSGQTVPVIFFRTMDACNAALAAFRETEAEKSKSLDKYR
jgi:hypothetical protein